MRELVENESYVDDFQHCWNTVKQLRWRWQTFCSPRLSRRHDIDRDQTNRSPNDVHEWYLREFNDWRNTPYTHSQVCHSEQPVPYRWTDIAKLQHAEMIILTFWLDRICGAYSVVGNIDISCMIVAAIHFTRVVSCLAAGLQQLSRQYWYSKQGCCDWLLLTMLMRQSIHVVCYWLHPQSNVSAAADRGLHSHQLRQIRKLDDEEPNNYWHQDCRVFGQTKHSMLTDITLALLFHIIFLSLEFGNHYNDL